MSTGTFAPLPRWARAPGIGVFLRLRSCALRRSVLALVRTPAKLSVVVLAWGVLGGGMFLLARHGFLFLMEASGIGPFLLDRVWYLLAFVLFVMLTISQTATVASTLLRSPEARYWMSLPLSASWILRSKWLESSFYSAWALVFLLAPFGAAYLLVLGQPWWQLSAVVALCVPMIAIATALATLVVLAWARWMRGQFLLRRELWPLVPVAVCAWLFWFLGEQSHERQETVWFVALQELLPRMRIAMAPWMPSSWMARAMSALLNGRWVELGLFTALLVTTAIAAFRLLDRISQRWLWFALREAAVPEDAAASGGPEPALRIRWWARWPFAACLAKDLALLTRDPGQWGQGVVFFGLLGAYFANIHRLTEVSEEPSWRTGLAVLNLGCTLLVFGSLAVRFLYPQMSLEARRLWLLRTLPGGLRQAFVAKLVGYSVVAVALIDGLLWLSVVRLEVPMPMRWWTASVGTAAGIGLVALTLGLGASWADPDATDPSRVVSSSNGALALVAMLTYVAVIVGSLVWAWVSWSAHQMAGFLLAGALAIAVSALVGGGAAYHGLRTFERLEF